MNKIQKIKQSNREEFDERFNWIGWRYDESVCKGWKDEKQVEEIKSFLSQAEDRIIEGLREELEKFWHENSRDEIGREFVYRQDFQDLIKQMDE